MNSFKKIAVIGAGTMGSGIAAQVANAGQKVLLLDLAGKDEPNSVVKAAKKRLLKSDPPALVHKSRIDLIEEGNIRDDFDLLAECDWIVEAVVERLDIKQDLYQRLNETVAPDCVVTSNTSTIPISLLVEKMPIDFRKRFAITHYFNPVRYMRLLELVRGVDTDEAIMDRLAHFNDTVMGKGVVRCGDTPGFLGNRVGVFALQVGMDEASKQGLSVEEADALMGRPMGIPKTGVFGLYDLIGVDLMQDVVASLENILPANDAFHAVGAKGNPVMPLIDEMIKSGFTGDKGNGGFYRLNGDQELVVDLNNGNARARLTELPAKAITAAETQAKGGEALPDLIDMTGNAQHTAFCKNMLGRVLAYAASLVPEVTKSPQDIDDAMKLGFNWVRGPFEMIDALGANRVQNLLNEISVDVPNAILKSVELGTFYRPDYGTLNVMNFDKTPTYAPVILPENSERFHLSKQVLTPLAQNEAASLYALDGDLRLVEFHSKANALTAASMEIVAQATKDHGTGVLIHNDAQHFSAGVDLNRFRAYIEAQDWGGIDIFLDDFQQAVKSLKYARVPVVGAPSGLSAGGGYEVLAHCDALVAHTNTVLGLVEAGVGVIPSGGGVKETYRHWSNTLNDPEQAAWNTWMQIGYGQTGSSPMLSAKLQYFLPERDEEVTNRDKLIFEATKKIKSLAQNYTAPAEPKFTLPGNAILTKMNDFMQKGVDDGMFFPHDKTVAMQVATIVVNTEADEQKTVSEQDMFDRERAAFITLAKTKETHARIASMLDDGSAIRN